MKTNHHNKGFTMMELLIVVAVIAVLVAIAIPTFNHSLERSRQAVDAANARSILALLASSVVSGDVEFPDNAGNQTKGVWVTVVRDQNSWPDAYGRQSSNMFCGADPGIVVRGENAPGQNSWTNGSAALTQMIKSSIGDLSVKSRGGKDGWDWYIVEYTYNSATDTVTSHIYSGFKGEKSSVSVKKDGTNIAKFMSRE